MLVLIAMQKLASSLVAAISRALIGRLARIQASRQQLANSENRLRDIKNILSLAEDDIDHSLTDELQMQEETIAELSANLKLMENEIPQLKILAEAAGKISHETKIEAIIEVIKERFSGRQVLFFTEYKAAQALLMSALLKHFREGCVTFINGDNRIEGIYTPDGETWSACPRDRYAAAERFNAGLVRFRAFHRSGW